MTDEEIEQIAEKLASKLQTTMTENIYRDAGRNLIGMLKHTVWAIIIAFAAWGAARYGTETKG